MTIDLKDLYTRSVSEFGVPPMVGHAVPLFHVKLDADQGDRSEHWYAVRRHSIGGSEAADALGVGYKSPRQLARLKLGIEPEFGGNYHTRRGTHMEAFALAELELRTERLVETVPWVLQHPEHEWATCNLDALIDGDTVGEVKCPGDHVRGDLARLIDGLPVAPMSAVGRYVIQCNHNMWVCGLERATLIVLPGTYEPVIVELRRDDALVAAIASAEAALWRLIDQGVEPPPRAQDIGDMAKAWRAEHQGEMETNDADLVEMFHELDAIRENRKEHEEAVKEYKALEEEAKAKMIERATAAGAKKLRVQVGGKSRSITLVEKRPRWDTKAMEAVPELVEKYRTKESKPEFRVS
jgi:putative phage-type endonuclease